MTLRDRPAVLRGFLLVILIPVVSTLRCSGTTGGAEAIEDPPAESGGGVPPALVMVSRVEEREVVGRVRLVGTASPWRHSTVASEVGGIVEALPVEEGDLVSEGRILARLRGDILERMLEKQQADLLADRAAYELTVSRRKRNQALLGGDVISQQVFDDSRLFERQALHRLASDEAEVLRLRQLIQKTTIRAPFSGIVIRKLTEVGEWVGEGGAVLELVDPGRMEVRIDLPEKYLSRLSPEGIRVQCDALPGIQLDATLSSIAPDGDPDTRTFPLRLEVSNPEGQVRGGMLCRTSLPLERSRSALFVPKDAVVDDGRERVVFTVDGDIARRVPVRRGESQGSRIEVIGSIEVGQEVVVRGNEGLRDGQSVRILEGSDGVGAPVEGGGP